MAPSKEGCVTEYDNSFYIASPHGPKYKVPKSVYEAIEEFYTERLNGSITLEVKAGSIAGVEGRKRYRMGSEPVVTT